MLINEFGANIVTMSWGDLHWYLDATEIEGGLESENQEKQTVTSIIHIPVRKEDQQKIIRCVVEHEALQTEMEAATELDIQCK